jgi:hypothetical protein
MTHTWVTRWTADELHDLVAEAQAEGWHCIVIESVTSGPATRSALVRVTSLGVKVASSPREVNTEIAAVTDRIRRSAYCTLTNRRESDRRPLLLVVADIDHTTNPALEKIALMGRAVDVHLALNERLRRRTSHTFQACLRSRYGWSK